MSRRDPYILRARNFDRNFYNRIVAIGAGFRVVSTDVIVIMFSPSSFAHAFPMLLAMLMLYYELITFLKPEQPGESIELRRLLERVRFLNNKFCDTCTEEIL